jgi:ribosome-associated toxin RatA of RatAB toxin-antitoxin module
MEASTSMMRTVDMLRVAASRERVFDAAADVERWPDILPHYRWVRLGESRADARIVEMAAWRPFGVFKWPTWWRSEMWVDRPQFQVRYRHIAGITRGMGVVWSMEASGDGTNVSIVHEWDGPAWPLIRRPAAEWVIGPIFVHGIASRTLAGIARQVERRER